MRPGFFLGTAMVLASFLTLLGEPALAQPRRDAQGVQPLDRLLPEIRRTHPGQIYDADGPSPAPDGSPHYHLKWMTPDGRIEWLDTDARTGRVMGSSPGRDTFDQPGAARRISPPAPPSYPTPDRFAAACGDRDYGKGGGRLEGGYSERGRGRERLAARDFGTDRR